MISISTDGFNSYNSVDVTAGVVKPVWLQNQTLYVFSVDSSDSITDASYTTVGNELRFTFDDLECEKIIVITSNSQTRTAMTATMNDMMSRLSEM